MKGNKLWVAIGTFGVVLGVVTASAPQAERQQTLPPLILDSLAGRDSFEFYCASCHGTTGKGDGPTASVLKTRPTDLTSLARRNDGAFPEVRVVEVVTGTGRQVDAHGSSGMPVWGPIFADSIRRKSASGSESITSSRTSRHCRNRPPVPTTSVPGCSRRIARAVTDPRDVAAGRSPRTFAECRQICPNSPREMAGSSRASVSIASSMAGT